MLFPEPLCYLGEFERLAALQIKDHVVMDERFGRRNGEGVSESACEGVGEES